MNDEEVVAEEQEFAIYEDARGEYHASTWKGSSGLVCLAVSKAQAERLAHDFNVEREEQMAASKKAKKAKAVKAPKAAKAPKVAKVKAERARDERLPSPGSVLRREYKGTIYEVRVNTDSFTLDGEQYGSLTAVALAITKYPAISGFEFFKRELEAKAEKAAASA